MSDTGGMAGFWARLALPLALAMAGCGDGGSAEPDAGAVDAGAAIPTLSCTPDLGDVFVMQSALVSDGEGIDLDGDGTPDNQFGILAGTLNPLLEMSWGQGQSAWMIDVAGLGTAATPHEVQVAMLNGRDVDIPPDPRNNYDGQGQFVMAIEQLDAWCVPTARFTAVQTGARIVGGIDRTEIVINSGSGVVRRLSIDVTVSMSDQGPRVTGHGYWVAPYCNLSTASFPGPDVDGTQLERIGEFLPADIDLDGDGLERVIVVNRRVERCIDGPGSGSTVIEGRDCACDPRIADGYSIATNVEGVRAKIVGTFGLSR